MPEYLLSTLVFVFPSLFLKILWTIYDCGIASKKPGSFQLYDIRVFVVAGWKTKFSLGYFYHKFFREI